MKARPTSTTSRATVKASSSADRFGIDGYIDLLSLCYTRSTVRHNRTYRVDPYNSTKTLTPEYSETTSTLDIGLHAHTAKLLTLGLSYTF